MGSLNWGLSSACKRFLKCPYLHSAANMASDWSKGMFDCMSTPTTCLYGWCCSCCMTYETAEDLGESGLLYVLLSWITPFGLAAALAVPESRCTVRPRPERGDDEMFKL